MMHRLLHERLRIESGGVIRQTGIWDPGDGTYLPLDGSPVEFIFPGEPGFLKTQPIYDCDAIMSLAPVREVEPTDDHL